LRGGKLGEAVDRRREFARAEARDGDHGKTHPATISATFHTIFRLFKTLIAAAPVIFYRCIFPAPCIGTS
jgi:hypothetical protein